jgi:hypothetical protein
LAIPDKAQAVFEAKTSFLDEVLSRTSSPQAPPYPALLADLQALSTTAAALARDRAAGTAFEGDFDFFAATYASVGSDQPSDWTAYQQLNGRFSGVQASILSDQAAFQRVASDFDALLKANSISRQDRAALVASVNGALDAMDASMKKMEQRVRDDRDSLGFDSTTSLDPVTVKQERDLLDAMEEHLLKSEALLRRTVEAADAMQAAWPQGPWIWTGPGLPDPGADLAQFWRRRDAFFRRRDEFLSLRESFAQVLH